MGIKSQWVNKKNPKKVYRGKYRYIGGEREFILVNEAKKKDKVIPFNAPKLAQNAGWKKIK